MKLNKWWTMTYVTSIIRQTRVVLAGAPSTQSEKIWNELASAFKVSLNAF